MRKNNYLLYSLLLLLLSSCFSCHLFTFESVFFPCRSYVPQSHKFGRYLLDVKTSKTTLQVGDTVWVDLKLNQQFYDSLSRQPINVNDQIAISINLTAVADKPASGNVFAVDTTIYNVFDQHFTTNVVKGRRSNPYLFECIRISGYWELHLQYVALKKGKYILYTRFNQIRTGEPDLPKGVCMLGNPETFNAQLKLNTVNNQISQVYPNRLTDPVDFFGFVID